MMRERRDIFRFELSTQTIVSRGFQWEGNVRRIVARPWILMMGESDATILWTRVVQWRRLSSVSDNVNAAAMTLADTTGSKT